MARTKTRTKTKWDWLRPDYDLTDDYGDLFELEPDYAAIMAELAGCSMVAWESGSNSIDDNGADVGDDCNADADLCYN